MRRNTMVHEGVRRKILHHGESTTGIMVRAKMQRRLGSATSVRYTQTTLLRVNT